MSDLQPLRRRWHRDVLVGVMTLSGVLVALCVFTHPLPGWPGLILTDAPTSSNLPTSWPEDGDADTLADWFAANLFLDLGLGIYVWLIGWSVLTLQLLVRAAWLPWTLRAFGWLLLVLASTATAAEIGETHLGGPLTGPGGAIGYWTRRSLHLMFEPMGVYLVLLAVWVLGCMLALESLVVALYRLVRWVLQTACYRLVRGVVRTTWRITTLLIRGTLHVLGAVCATIGRFLVAIGYGLQGKFPPLSTAAASASCTSLTSSASSTSPMSAGSSPSSRGSVPLVITTPAWSASTAAIPIHHPDDKAPHSSEGKAPPESVAVGKTAGTLRHSPSARHHPKTLPDISLLDDPEPVAIENQEAKLREVANLLEKTFKDFGVTVKVVGIRTGPVITMYEIALETGLRLTKVTALADDVALNLCVPSVRIVAPLPGRNTVGVEVPNEKRAIVRLKEVMLAAPPKTAKAKLPLYLGKDTEGRPIIEDLADMPHLLIAGRTGTGKSVCLNSIIVSLLMTRTSDQCRLLMVDPKHVEFGCYATIPHLMHPIIYKPEKAEAALAWAVDKMEERYELLSRARVRKISQYNELSYEEILKRVKPESEGEKQRIPAHMPYIVIIVDEVGDLMAQMKKEVEGHIIRLAQKSRAAGIHLILATQRPTVDVITGLIKSNLPARIAFQVTNRTDSIVVLDEKGAEKLLGMGDMLLLQSQTGNLIRGQGAYISEPEIERVVEVVSCEEPQFDEELLQAKSTAERAEASERGAFGPELSAASRKNDPIYHQAVEVVIHEGRGSTSLLQQALGIGYGRASRLIKYMEEDGIVGGYNGSQAREVLITMSEWNARRGGGTTSPLDDDSAPPLAESA